MLVLTRKPQETIRIGDHITISILRVKGRAVRVGIEAPGDVRVMRGELATSNETAMGALGPEVRADRPHRNADHSDRPDEREPAPPLKLSTRHINQILASRRNERRLGRTEEKATLTTPRSSAWDDARHMPVA